MRRVPKAAAENQLALESAWNTRPRVDERQ